MSNASNLLAESAMQTRIFFRTTVAAFFTLVLPLMFLVMLNLLIPEDPASALPVSQYITPALAVFGMVTATFTNLAINTSMARDEGILKRVAATPMPMIIHLGGRIVSAVLIGLLSVALMLVVGRAFFSVDIPWSGLPLFFLLLVFGAATFSALGLAVAATTRSSRAAPAIANFVILPLAFISGVFFPLDTAPQWVQTTASYLPLEPLATSAVDIFVGDSEGFPVRAIVSLVVWGAVGLVLAVRFFSYEPSESTRRQRQRASVSS